MYRHESMRGLLYVHSSVPLWGSYARRQRACRTKMRAMHDKRTGRARLRKGLPESRHFMGKGISRMKLVIIGNSAAAVGAIEGFRSLDPHSSITVISREPDFTYSRPLISYWLGGKCTESGMRYRAPDFYEKNAVTPRLGYTAAAIDARQHTVLLDGGECVGYDKLLVATGSRPFIPPLDGLEGVEKKFTFLSKADAQGLNEALTPQSRVLILGAGLIGLKCAEGIAGRAASVTVVDLAPQILNSILDAEGASRVQAHLEKYGIHFILSDSAASVRGGEAHLSSGGRVAFDILVIAVGVRPNTELLEAAGAKVNRGVVVDENGATSLPDIYAAGDCAQSFDHLRQDHRVLALLPNAYMQGESAGIAIAGGQKPFNQAMPMNSIGFFGLHMITAGVMAGEMLDESREGSYKKLFVKDGRLVGYILIGDVARAGIYTALIRERTDLSTLDFALIAQRPQLMAFSRQVRQEKLGGFR